jgi:hypothetical protein
MAAKGYYKDPVERSCWGTCQSCGRCQNFGSNSLCGNVCSGRWDPDGKIDPDGRDFCDCKNGWLRWKTQKGQMLYAKYNRNPFSGTVQSESVTEDERDYDAYVNDMREKMGDPTYTPVTIG